MKQLSVVILLIIATNAYSFAQDTVKVTIPGMHSPQPKSNLILPDNKNLKNQTELPDYNKTNNYSPVYQYTQKSFSFDNPVKKAKTNIFNAPYSGFIIPATLISYGIITRGNKPLQALDKSTHNEISEHLTKSIPIDDYTQFAPALAVYGLDFMGIKAKHNFRDRTIVMATSYFIMGATVQTMKQTIDVERPNGYSKTSFPSGHTATAFTGAHILFKEYKEASPWIGVAGYMIATGTGTLRVLNKKHWISDVVTGAGIGIASAEIGYLLLPVFQNILGIEENKRSLVIAPAIERTNGDKNYAIGLAYTF